jgi:hemin uptake protein HemP
MHDNDNDQKPRITTVSGTEAAPREVAHRAAPRRTSSRELFGGSRELVIDHDGRQYQLRITQNGKLILTA